MGVPRPRLYEVVALANAALIAQLIPRVGRVGFNTRASIWALTEPLALFSALLAAGVALRLVFAWIRAGRGAARRLARSYVSPRGLVDVARLLAAAVVVSYGYAWLKVFLPLLNARLFDDVLYAIDNALHLGINPNRFVRALFPGAGVRRFLDFEYAAYLFSMLGAFGWFASTASPRERTRFAAGFAFLWLVGSWMYLATPSLGPCYAFRDEYAEVLADFPLQTAMQGALLHQYALVRTFPRRSTGSLDLIPGAGIAAMPSLHVGAQVFYAIWARRRCRPLFVLFTVFTLLTFVGSLIAGWHYAIDGYAGVLLAFAAAWFGRRAAP